MKKHIFILALLSAGIAATGCSDDKAIWGNPLYISSARVNADLLIDPNGTGEISRTIEVRTSQPAANDITVTLAARPEMAAEYNARFGDNARALPEKYYKLSGATSLVRKGAVMGESIEVTFTATNELDRNFRYVLPVTITDAGGAELLESKRTTYFVFKGSALINVVADISKIKFAVNWTEKARAMATGMNAITIECLVRSSDWKTGNGYGLGSVFGTEGEFLVRMGDADRDNNQLQFVNSGGSNWPSKAESPALPSNKWVHIAVVLNTADGTRVYYVDGTEVARDNGGRKSQFSIAGTQHIGYAYEDARYFPGEMSEMRIWNVERTAAQIKNGIYYIDPKTDNAGLVAYWKFNEGSGNIVRDHSGNGTHLQSQKSNLTDNNKSEPRWVPVELPE